MMSELVSTRESSSATTLFNPGTCRMLDVNCKCNPVAELGVENGDRVECSGRV